MRELIGVIPKGGVLEENHECNVVDHMIVVLATVDAMAYFVLFLF